MKYNTHNPYDERYVRWSGESRKQFSYLSNLLLTIGIALLTLLFKNKDYSNVYFTIKDANYDLTLSVMSLFALALSIYFGIVTAFNRLWDFRTKSEINLIRKRFYKNSR